MRTTLRFVKVVDLDNFICENGFGPGATERENDSIGGGSEKTCGDGMLNVIWRPPSYESA